MNIEYDERKFKELLLYVADRLSGDRAGGATKLNKVSSSPTSPMSDERAQRSRVPNTGSCPKVLRPVACFQFANSSSPVLMLNSYLRNSSGTRFTGSSPYALLTHRCSQPPSLKPSMVSWPISKDSTLVRSATFPTTRPAGGSLTRAKSFPTNLPSSAPGKSALLPPNDSSERSPRTSVLLLPEPTPRQAIRRQPLAPTAPTRCSGSRSSPTPTRSTSGPR